MSVAPLLRLSDIGVLFNPGGALETHALKSVSFDIGEAEFITVVGGNGSGKSTLLNVIAGDLAPTQGNILLDGIDITALPAHRRAGDIARVFQDPVAGTCAELSIEENLSLAAARGDKKTLRLAVTDERRSFYRQHLKNLRLPLSHRLSDPVSALSGGQRQALSLVMASLSKSKLLLLDEHTAALDPRMAEFVLALTRRIRDEYQLTILMITHSMQTALEYGNRTLMLRQGNLILDIAGAARAAMQVPDLLALFRQPEDTEAATPAPIAL